MNKQKGIAHILLLLLILVVIGAAVYFILPRLGLKVPSIPGVKKEPTVSLKKDYKNPFEKNTQYVNPFDQYKSPLVTLKK